MFSNVKPASLTKELASYKLGFASDSSSLFSVRSKVDKIVDIYLMCMFLLHFKWIQLY